MGRVCKYCDGSGKPTSDELGGDKEYGHKGDYNKFFHSGIIGFLLVVQALLEIDRSLHRHRCSMDVELSFGVALG